LAVFSGIFKVSAISLRVKPFISSIFNFRRFLKKSNKKFHFDVDIYVTPGYT
jgi:hypothetical protein